MPTTREVLVTELSPSEVDYDLSKAPESFKTAFDEGSVALSALAYLGCSAERDDASLRVTLPEDIEESHGQIDASRLKTGENLSDTDFLIMSGFRRLDVTGRPSELSTGVVEGVVSLQGFKQNHLAVRRHATYKN